MPLQARDSERGEELLDKGSEGPRKKEVGATRPPPENKSVTHCPGLNNVNLRHCHNLTGIGVEALASLISQRGGVLSIHSEDY